MNVSELGELNKPLNVGIDAILDFAKTNLKDKINGMLREMVEPLLQEAMKDVPFIGWTLALVGLIKT